MDIHNRTIWELFETMQGEIARELRVMLGEEQYDQRIFTADEHSRRVDALIQCAEDSYPSAADRHAGWCQMHVDNGWVYGPEFKPSEKQHPNLKPWDQLSAEARSKATIFAIVAKYARAVDACAAPGKV